MLGKFVRRSGRRGAYDEIRDRFPLVTKSKEGSVGDMVGRGEGGWAVLKEVSLSSGTLRTLVVTESDEQSPKSATDQFVAERSETGYWKLAFGFCSEKCPTTSDSNPRCAVSAKDACKD